MMRRLDLRAQILLAIGGVAAGVACGSETATSSGDASTDGLSEAQASHDAASDANGDSSAPQDGSPDTNLGDDGAAGDGAHPDGPFSPRRPFLVGSSLRSARAAGRTDWAGPVLEPAALDPATLAALARAWEKDALEEHASIAAFARFTMLLLAVGAPADMVAAAQRASLDEVRHARGCFALARRYGGAPVGPGPLDIGGALGALSLADLAELTAEEGCVGETLGVVLALEQLAVARDRDVAVLLERIVRDEARHADLAWSFVRWAIDRGGTVVARAVHRAARRAIDKVRALEMHPNGVDLDAWHAHGRVTCAEARAASELGIRDVLEPCLAALLARANGGARFADESCSPI